MTHLVVQFRQGATLAGVRLDDFLSRILEQPVQPWSDYLSYGGPDLLDLLAAEVVREIGAGSPVADQLRQTAGRIRLEDRKATQEARARIAAVRTPSTVSKEVREAYAALEIPVGSPADKVREAWRSMMRKYHPDRYQQLPEHLDASRELAAELNRAQEILLAWLEKRRP